MPKLLPEVQIKESLFFFDKYKGKEVPQSLKEEYENSVKEIFMELIDGRRKSLGEIVERYIMLTQKYGVEYPIENKAVEAQI